MGRKNNIYLTHPRLRSILVDSILRDHTSTKNSSKTAKRFHLRMDQLFAILSKEGEAIPKTKRLTHSIKRRVYDTYKATRSLRVVAKIYGCSHEWVRQIVFQVENGEVE